MRKWDGISPQPCVEGFGMGTHLLVASRGGWSYLCSEDPERWQDMLGNPTTEPLIIPNSDRPTCKMCKYVLELDEGGAGVCSRTWPIARVPMSDHRAKVPS